LACGIAGRIVSSEFKLRDDQKTLINEMREALRVHQSVLMRSPTGAGKTVMAAYMVGTSHSKGFEVIFMVHRRELLTQTSKTFEKSGIPHTFIAAGNHYNPRMRVRIATVGTLGNRLEKIKPPKLLIVDECFPAGTLIDGTPIETLRIGDYVSSYNHDRQRVEKRRIMRLYKNIPKNLVTITLSNGKKITCTPNHPFFNGQNYIPAVSLDSGSMVYCITERRINERSKLQGVCKGYSDSNKIPSGQTESRSGCVLLKGMFKNILSALIVGNNGKNQQNPCQRAHEEKQSNEARGCTSKGFNDATHNAMEADGSRWKRKAAKCRTAVIGICAWLADGIYFNNRWRLSANSLQAGYSEPSFKNGNRSGWLFSLFTGKTETGQAQGNIFKQCWVESVEVHKQTGDGKFGGLCPDGFVYNVEVEKNHNYFANGVLVHNCHHTSAAGWAKIVKWARAGGTRIVGLTATPWRLSGEGLSDFFDHMVQGVDVEWLIEHGFLSKYRAFCPANPDMSEIHERSGDFVQDEVEEVMMRRAIISDFVGQWKQKALGKRTIGFAASIKHSKALVDEFNVNGIPAAHVDANTPPEQRRAHIMDFASGVTPVIFNVDLFGEGFDLSAIAGRDVPIECVIQGRPTLSLSLHLQQLGRGLRPKSEPAIFLDHAGNIMRHGLPDSPREWSLKGRIKKKRGEEETLEAMRRCPMCFSCHAPHIKECPECHHVYEVKSRILDEVDGSLKEMTREAVDKMRAENPTRHTVQLELPLEELIEKAYKSGMPPGKAEQWAAKQFTMRAAQVSRSGVYAKPLSFDAFLTKAVNTPRK
jgi:superfamily II DNA or RNA helicase